MSGARNGFAQALANLQIVQQRNELFDQLFVDLSNANLNHDKIKKAIAKAKSFLITIKDHERADALEKLSQHKESAHNKLFKMVYLILRLCYKNRFRN